MVLKNFSLAPTPPKKKKNINEDPSDPIHERAWNLFAARGSFRFHVILVV